MKFRHSRMKNDTEEKTSPETDAEATAADNVEEIAEETEATASEASEGTGDLLEQITKLQDEVGQHKDRYLRSVADMENLRKRMARDKEDIRRRATASLIEDLLPALDNMQMGLSSADQHPEAKEIAKGFEMVSAQIKQILQSHGLDPIEPAAGEAFDPHIHESVALQPHDEIEEQHVISLMRVGYKLNDNLLRPASVVVSSGKE